MDCQYCKIAVPVAFLVLGVLAILLLTIPTEDMKEPPDYMVRLLTSVYVSANDFEMH